MSDLTYLGPPSSAEAALGALAGPIRRWFAGRFGGPTAAQRLAWPAVAAGHSLLLCAETGGGKTLAAFLPVFGRLLAAPRRAGVRCLYVAPLKALGNDARTNLRRHLREVRNHLPAGVPAPRVGLRTGDTPPRRRRRLREDPPEVLLTTPESLAVLLSQPAARALFAALQWVIVDEVHALAPNKRGADLTLSLERLEALAGGGLQRVGLSATCVPPAEAAHFLAGTGRPCAVAVAPTTTALDLAVEPLEPGGGFLAQLVTRLGPEIRANRSTLIFTNARALAERLAWALRHRYPEWDDQIAVHHGALAAGRRRDVERRFKRGLLRAVTTSTSLELGIDIGAVDNVVLVHPPGGVTRLLQRVGRGGHGPGRPRRGLVLTADAAGLLEAAVTAAAGRAGQLEPLRVPPCPLDVLCQQLLGMAAERPWDADDAFALVRHAYPYRGLTRDDFDACLRYLAGRHRDGWDWLPARVALDSGRFVIADRRTERLLRLNLGTILAEEPRPVRLAGAGPEVGHLDETFADRLQPGDRFLLDGRCLECRQAHGPEVVVDEVVGRPRVPRWVGDRWPVSLDLARRVYLLRAQAAEALRDGPGALRRLLRRDYGLGEAAALALATHFQWQERVSEIPDAATCLVEVVANEAGVEYDVHTPLHRPANDALARALALRLARDRGLSVTTLVADLGFAVFCRSARELTAEDFRALLAEDRFDADLDEAVAASPALREQFRRVAQTGLMLLRHPLGRRRRVGGQDWAERRLFEQVRDAEPDFVLLRQARREVREACAAGDARAYLESLPRLTVRCRRLGRPSPFVEGRTQPAAGPAEAADGPEEALRRLHAALTGNPAGGGPGERS